jgi:hypothetical protein
MSRIVLFMLVALAEPAWGADLPSPLSVCDLIAHRNEYAGKIVAVRGVSEPGGHGRNLVPASECIYVLSTRGGFVWPNIMNLTYPDNRSPDPYEHAAFSLDWKAMRREKDYCLKKGYRAGVDVEVATFIGLFLAYPNLDDYRGRGFGPGGGGAPFQIVIKTISDVSVTIIDKK